ncbi:MAG: hypothetical protein JST85_13970 [Acidobacteria bacterium]|nr:hypothetical protein [Acidobacteriota bacterium]
MRTKVSLAVLLLVLLGTSGWYYFSRPEPVEIATCVPESAMAYLEINNLPQLATDLTATRAWQQLAPAYGLSDKLAYLSQAGKLSWLAGLTGNNEATVLARAQAAIVITGLEAREEAIKPRFALLILSARNENALRAVIEKHLPELANDLLGPTSKLTSDQAGTALTVYRSTTNSDKQLFSAQAKDIWILANHADAIRDCLNTIQGRQASMANNFYRQQAQPVIGTNATAFGFVTGEGVKRLLRLGTYLASNGIVGKAALAGAVGDVFTEFSGRTCDGLAYGASFENGQVVDRYVTLFKPELTDKLKEIVKINPAEAQALSIIPAAAQEVTIYKVFRPSQTLEEIEKAVSARVDAAQSFLLHQFVLGMREAAFGDKSAELAKAAIGDEIASFNLSKNPTDRVWLIAARDPAKIAQLAENILTLFQNKRVATLSRETVNGHEVLSSSEQFRGSAVFIGNFLALGQRSQLIGLIEANQARQSLKTSPQLAATAKFATSAPSLSYSSVKDESREMMTELARFAGLAVIPAKVTALDQLPLAASATSIGDQGLLVETHSPFGNLPFLVSLIVGTNSPTNP